MSKKIRSILSFLLLAVVLFTALPKVYLHKLMGHTHINELNFSNDGSTQFSSDNNTQNCELEKFETPVYFTIFKFILNCTPFRHNAESVSDNYIERSVDTQKISQPSLRGPPTV
ncbi:MAG TPA: hypothetical protein VGF30_02625 [Bacteroidia bacterium]